ncbi:MAG: sorbosone dehydrogenase [Bacteroidetes bacterium]|jgi:glucose/arabinose dehydrogenase|nr:sorbosone dehydrogenase [Bacteroidota bacterium]
MKSIYYLPTIALILLMVSGCSKTTDNNDTAIQGDSLLISLPDNFSATIFADSLGAGRHLAIRENNDVYVTFRSGRFGNKGPAALRDVDGDNKADSINYFGDHFGTGVEIYDNHIYFENSMEVFRYALQANELIPGTEKEIIVSGFLEQGAHDDKTFTFDSNGNMYVNIGAPSNACMEQSRTMGSPGQDPCPELDWQAGIWKFNALAPGQTLQQDGERYATGIRNGLALHWNHNVDKLYVVQHGRDQLGQFFPELYNNEDNAELPAEEMFLVEQGNDFGWPYCYYDQRKEQKVLAPEYGGDGTIVDRCADTKDPIMAFPGHIAPNDLVFYNHNHFPEKYHNGAFIAFHGSWNRAPEPQEGFVVAFVPFEGDQPSGDWEIFADGFQGKDTIFSPGDATFRPCGLAVGPDGALYVIDSQVGRIWKIWHKDS